MCFTSKERNNRKRGRRGKGEPRGSGWERKKRKGKEKKREKNPKFTFLAVTLHAQLEQVCQLAKASPALN